MNARGTEYTRLISDSDRSYSTKIVKAPDRFNLYTTILSESTRVKILPYRDSYLALDNEAYRSDDGEYIACLHRPDLGQTKYQSKATRIQKRISQSAVTCWTILGDNVLLGTTTGVIYVLRPATPEKNLLTADKLKSDFFSAHASKILAFTANADYAVSSASDGSVFLWSSKKAGFMPVPDELFPARGYPDCYNKYKNLHFLPDGSLLALNDDCQLLRLIINYQSKTITGITDLQCKIANETAFAVLNNGLVAVLSASSNKMVKLINPIAKDRQYCIAEKNLAHECKNLSVYQDLLMVQTKRTIDEDELQTLHFFDCRGLDKIGEGANQLFKEEYQLLLSEQYQQILCLPDCNLGIEIHEDRNGAGQATIHLLPQAIQDIKNQLTQQPITAMQQTRFTMFANGRNQTKPEAQAQLDQFYNEFGTSNGNKGPNF